MHEYVVTGLSVHMPNVLRWAGGVARLLRGHQIALDGKGTGSAATDALTLADLSLQELIVGALRDSDPIFRHCRIDAEESSGDLAAFPPEAPLTIGLDPIDGTRKYRDHTGCGYSTMLHLRSKTAVLYSLVYIPELGEHGWWVEASEERLISGPDDPSRSAVDVLRSLPVTDPGVRLSSSAVYVTGFRKREGEALRRIGEAGLVGLSADQVSGCPYELLARGELSGGLIHSPNVYDFPVLAHLSQLLGGNAVWVQSGQPIDFRNLWLDDKAKMLRLSGIVAFSASRDSLKTLCELARDWNPERNSDADLLV